MPIKNNQLPGKKWLNIIIITVSAMFLILMLIGRMMDKNSVQQPIEKSRTPAFLLQQIDFGEITLFKQGNQWQSSEKALSQKEIDLLLKHWQHLLTQTGKNYSNHNVVGKTVLLYFSNMPQPVVCKVSFIENEMLITFVNHSRQFVFDKAMFNNYYPELKSTSQD